MSNEDEQAKTDGTNVGAAAFLPAAVMAQVAPQPKKPIPNPPGTGKKAQKKARAQAKQAKYDTMMGMMARSTNDTGLGMMGMGMGAGPGYFNPAINGGFSPPPPPPRPHAAAVPRLPAGQPATAADTSPLTAANAMGRRVLVPRDIWPTYSCSEHGGAGWEARVVSATRVSAVVCFAQARDRHGRPYPNERLPLHVLQPL